MKFKITSKKPDGTEQFHIYDNTTNDVWSSRGIPVALANDPRVSSSFKGKGWSPDHGPEYYQKEFRNLRIQLGVNCNFHCKYCIEKHSEAHNKVHQIVETPVAMPPKQSAENLVNLMVKNGIKPRTITYWGGEPLVYWKTIVELQPLLEKAYPDMQYYGLCTNGSLLTVEKAKFMVEHRIGLTMSHDGWSFNVYRNDKDPLDNPEVVKALQYYYDNIESPRMMSFNIVITPENCDILKLPEWFEQKVGRKVRLHFESIVKNDPITDGIIKPFSRENIRTLLNAMLMVGTQDPNECLFPQFREEVNDFIWRLVNKKPIDTARYVCSAPYSRQVAIDMLGNILRCHGTDPRTNTIGHLSQIEDCINDSLLSTLDREHCKDCPFVHLCMGGCPMVDQETLDHYCTNLKIYNSGFFAAVWKLLFNGTLVKIESMSDEEADRILHPEKGTKHA